MINQGAQIYARQAECLRYLPVGTQSISQINPTSLEFFNQLYFFLTLNPQLATDLGLGPPREINLQRQHLQNTTGVKINELKMKQQKEDLRRGNLSLSPSAGSLWKKKRQDQRHPRAAKSSPKKLGNARWNQLKRKDHRPRAMMTRTSSQLNARQMMKRKDQHRKHRRDLIDQRDQSGP